LTSVESPAATLRNLYFARFGFAVVWAALLFVIGSSLGPVTVALLVLYPVVDLVAAVVDARSSTTARATPVLYVNMALSLLAAVGLALAVGSGLPAVLRVWGAWAIAAGATQLIVAIGRRRELGGQWPMILSGAISLVAGTGFILQAATPTAALTGPAGYAVLGGVFFLVSALRMRSAARPR
jgi:uncharacterized membrane protein HdeD (DUF308 family)